MRGSWKGYWIDCNELNGLLDALQAQLRMRHLKISVITAVRNGADTVAATLRSVAEQDYASIEHIIVDGASTDATLAVVRFNADRVARVISERDSGVYDAFNKGLRVATGEAITYLNCGDTYASSTALSSLAAAMSAHGAEASFSDLLIVGAADPVRIIRRYSSRNFTPERMRFGLMPAHPTLLLTRDVYRGVGEYDPRFRIAGDFELCLRVFAARSTRYCYVPEALVRMPTGGLSNRGWRSKWEITREMREACEMHHVPTSLARLCLRFPMKMMEMM